MIYLHFKRNIRRNKENFKRITDKNFSRELKGQQITKNRRDKKMLGIKGEKSKKKEQDRSKDWTR